MRPSFLVRALLLGPALLLGACESEPENVQAKSENMQRLLETRANEIAAEAENDVDAQVAPLDNEADALLNRMNAVEPGNVTANAD